MQYGHFFALRKVRFGNIIGIGVLKYVVFKYVCFSYRVRF